MRLILPYDTIHGHFVVVLARSRSKSHYSKRVNVTAFFFVAREKKWGSIGGMTLRCLNACRPCCSCACVCVWERGCTCPNIVQCSQSWLCNTWFWQTWHESLTTVAQEQQLVFMQPIWSLTKKLNICRKDRFRARDMISTAWFWKYGQLNWHVKIGKDLQSDAFGYRSALPACVRVRVRVCVCLRACFVHHFSICFFNSLCSILPLHTALHCYELVHQASAPSTHPFPPFWRKESGPISLCHVSSKAPMICKY